MIMVPVERIVEEGGSGGTCGISSISGILKWCGSVAIAVLLAGILVGCATSAPSVPTLSAPAGTNHKAAEALERGNRLFASGQWAEAQVQYEAAVGAQPSLAEAHYNLALTLERLGDRKRANDHYIQAANLAPGHKVIWNSPPLRRHGDVPAGTRSDVLYGPALGGF